MKQKRINHIIETIQKVTAGDYSKRIKISKKRDELDALASTINLLLEEIDLRLKKHEDQSEALLNILEDLDVEKKKLKIAEERRNYAMKGTNEGLWDWDLITNEVYFSSKWKEMIGYKVDEIPNKFSEWVKRLHKEDKKRVLNYVKNYLKAKGVNDFEIEYKMKHKKKYYVPILARAFLIKNNNGEPIRMVGTHVDMTEKKKNEEKLETILDTIPALIWYKNKEGKYVKVNKFFSDSVGIPEETIVGMTDLQLFPKKLAIKYKKDDIKVINRKNKVSNIIQQYKKSDGSWGWIKTDKLPYYENNKFEGILGMGIDITKEKEFQEELEKSKALYKKIVENTQDMIYSYDKEGIITYVTPNCSHYGYAVDDVIGKNVFSFVHPKDKKRTIEDMKKSMSTGSAFPTIFRLLNKGRKKFTYVEEFSSVILKNGKFVEGLGAIRDITKRMKYEEELKRRADVTNSIMVFIDKDGKIVMINKKGAKILGYKSPKQLMGKDWFDTCLPKNVRKKVRILSNKMLAGKMKVNESFENEILTKTGKKILVGWHGEIILDNKGKIIGHLRAGKVL